MPVCVAPYTKLLAQWPLVEPGGFTGYETAAAVFRRAQERGVALSTVDALLASVALEYDAALFTLDRDFERLTFTGLRLHRFHGSRPEMPAD